MTTIAAASSDLPASATVRKVIGRQPSGPLGKAKPDIGGNRADHQGFNKVFSSSENRCIVADVDPFSSALYRSSGAVYNIGTDLIPALLLIVAHLSRKQAHCP